MDINYFMKIQNAYGTKNKREKDLIEINYEMSKHFEDTFDTENVLVNGIPTQLMIIKDTDGNTYKKKIKSRHEDKFNIGDYVNWNNQVWIITLIDSDEKTWNRGYMYLCTVPLRWQNTNGEIIERWAYAEDFTKYSSGVTPNNVISIGDNQYGLTIPIDAETKKLNRDMRFAIDFDDSENPDIYKLTNKKAHLNNNMYFGRGGTITLTVSFDAFNKDTDKKVINNNQQKVWICNYKSPISTPLYSSVVELSNISAVITGSQNLKPGFPRTFTANFSDNKSDIPWGKVNFNWNVISDFYIEECIHDNKIELCVDRTASIGSSIILQMIVDNKVCCQKEITIIDIA